MLRRLCGLGEATFLPDLFPPGGTAEQMPGCQSVPRSPVIEDQDVPPQLKGTPLCRPSVGVGAKNRGRARRQKLLPLLAEKGASAHSHTESLGLLAHSVGKR